MKEQKNNYFPVMKLPQEFMDYQKSTKNGIPLRPIVNTIGSPTYELDKHVAKILDPLLGHTNSFIKDQNKFIRIINNEMVKPEDILISFDVVSLFTKILLDEAIHIVKEVMDPERTKLAEVCLCSTFFSY
jgi:hypothetical protein